MSLMPSASVSLPGCYRAIFLNVDSTGDVQAMVPAVSGQIPMTMRSIAAPTNVLSPGDVGWVMYEGGDPSVPVWLGVMAPTPAVQPGYWASRCVSGGTLSTSSEAVVPVSTPNMASGFSLSGSGVQCNVAGKYIATFLLMANATVTNGAATWAGITQFRGAIQIVNWDNIQSGIGATNPYQQVVATGEFDLQAGDILYCVAQAPAASTTVGAQTSFMIAPMGGPKGDIGPSGGPVPHGGVLNQVIVKNSSTDFDVSWQDQTGVVAYKFLAGATPIVVGSSFVVLGTLTNVPLSAGRLYRATWFMRAMNTGTGNLRFQFGTIPTGTGWALDAYKLAPGTYDDAHLASLGTVTVNGTYTLQFGASSTPSGSNLWTDGGGYIMIEDMGLNRGQQ